MRTMLPPHSLLPTRMLLRSLLVAGITSHPMLLAPGLATLKLLSKPRGYLLNVERNPVLHSIVKNVLYNHFCAGENASEVKATIQNIKNMGFRGVILTYAKESPGKSSNEKDQYDLESQQVDADIEAWHQGVLQTVRMVSDGDFLALKLTGAGAAVTRSLSLGKPLPTQMESALMDICDEALSRRVNVFLDAEQHHVQSGIDKVALDLMRRYNQHDIAVVFNTYQAYLKSTSSTLLDHLHYAKQKGFTIGIKLVRGAYMSTEPRHLIHDTKAETDASYDLIAKSLIQGQPAAWKEDESFTFPRLQLFLATHNRNSTLKAQELQQARVKVGLPRIQVQYGQLLGMADEVSFTLLQRNEQDIQSQEVVVSEVYKCLTWGTIGDCIFYLLRRANENKDAVSRTLAEYRALRAEVMRRIMKLLTF
ncbi:FAD-linked oxidoreductase-like protein [Trichoderma chlorosporum]